MPPMRATDVPRGDNLLLAALPLPERGQLRHRLERAHLREGQVICDAGERLQYAYFPQSGLLSFRGVTSDGGTLELARAGNEGMAGISIVFDVTTVPHRVVVQAPTTALRIAADTLADTLRQHGSLERLLLAYAHTLLVQISQAAVCINSHTISQRLSGWLLDASKRNQSQILRVTQAGLGDILGVGRSSVSSAATHLQDLGVIRLRHGTIRILNRNRLQTLACDCYHIDGRPNSTHPPTVGHHAD
jgi:CRP-like cAMP-binding protein